MTSKEAILEYLKNHPEFTIAQVASAYGFACSSVASSARALLRSREIYVSSSRWRDLRYRQVANKPRKKKPNNIFDECRNSDTMKRILMVYGVQS